MAANDAKRDQNHVTTLLAVTNDSSKEVRKLLVDPSTDELLVQATISGTVPVSGTVNQGTASATENWRVNLTQVGSTAFALGQQLASASLPVVLTAAQITTLTPQTDALTNTQLRAAPVAVSGAAADGAAVSGNPVLMSGKEEATGFARTLRTDADGELIVHQKSASHVQADGVSNTRQVAAATDETTLIINEVYPYNYNGSTWDRVRGNATDGMLVNLGANNDVDVALPAGTNNIGLTTPARSSERPNASYKTAQLSNQTADATLYTVTGGKTFFLETLIVAAFNTSTASTGVLEIKDGNGGTTRIPLLMTAAGVAAQLAASAAVAVPITFDGEPMQFTNAVYMDIISGTITYSVMMVGYEI